MILYQIHLPVHDNAGHNYDDGRFAGFESCCLDVAGGFTDFGYANGQWKDAGAKPKTYADTSRVYQVACNPDDWSTIQRFAKHAWRDQVALFVAKLGEAELV